MKIDGPLATGDSTIGTYEPTVVVTDGTYYASASFEWDVGGAISITDPGAQANVVGDAVSLAVGATDSTSGTLTYAASGLPNGLSINTSTGLISGTVGSGATAIGSFTSTVTVGDGTNTASDTFSWTITGTGTITLSTPSNQTSTEWNSASLSLSATDSISGSTLKYFAAGLPFGLKINPGTGVITGTVAVNDVAYGPYSVAVIATDSTYSAVETFTWTVDSPIAFSAVADQSNNENDTVSVSTGATDSIGGSTVRYAALGLLNGLTLNATTGAIGGALALGTAAGGTYTVTLLATDGTYSTTETVNWSASNPITLKPIVDQTNYEGDTVSLSMSSTYTGTGTLTYSANNLPLGLSINPSTGAITRTISSNAAANGPYSVTVKASDGTYSTSQTFTWTVNDPITVADHGVQSYTQGQSVSLAVSASSIIGGALNYVASGLVSGLSINSVTGLITGTINSLINAAGVFFSTVVVSNGTFSASETIWWKVGNPNLVFAADTGNKQDEKEQPARVPEVNLLTPQEAVNLIPKDAQAKAAQQFKDITGLSFDDKSVRDKQYNVGTNGKYPFYVYYLGFTSKGTTLPYVQYVYQQDFATYADGKRVKLGGPRTKVEVSPNNKGVGYPDIHAAYFKITEPEWKFDDIVKIESYAVFLVAPGDIAGGPMPLIGPVPGATKNHIMWSMEPKVYSHTFVWEPGKTPTLDIHSYSAPGGPGVGDTLKSAISAGWRLALDIIDRTSFK